MLFDDKRRALRRALAGALLGMAGGGLAAKQLIAMVDNPSLCCRMGEEASKRARKMFSEEAFVHNHDNYYRSLIKSNHRQ